jgi:hypothetical protein
VISDALSGKSEIDRMDKITHALRIDFISLCMLLSIFDYNAVRLYLLRILSLKSRKITGCSGDMMLAFLRLIIFNF